MKLSLIKGLFGGTPDSILTPIRNIIRLSTTGFPLSEISSSLIEKTRNLTFTDDEIEARVNEAS